MRGADEAAGIIAFRFLGGVVAQTRLLEIGAHSGGAAEKSNLDAGLVHHMDMLVEIEQHPMRDETRCAVFVVGYDLAPTEVLRHQFAWREVVLEIDDHLALSPATVSPVTVRQAGELRQGIAPRSSK